MSFSTESISKVSQFGWFRVSDAGRRLRILAHTEPPGPRMDRFLPIRGGKPPPP